MAQPQQKQEYSPEQQAFLQERAKQQEILQEKLNQHVQSYPIELLFPANVSPLVQEKDDLKDAGNSSSTTPTTGSTASTASKKLRTSSDFINNRLLDTPGLSFMTTTTLSETTEALNDFVQDLQSTNCYDSVQVILGSKGESNTNYVDTSTSTTIGKPKQLNVLLAERNWYKLYIGGGVKHENMTSNNGPTGTFPKLQFESTASLINLAGMTDLTQCSYTLDQTSTPTLSVTHTRPFYSLFNPGSAIGNAILQTDQGSKFGITFRGNVDTLDYEHTRSSKDHIQSLGVRVANTTANSSSFNTSIADNIYIGLDWSLSHRDIIPRRHKSLPYLCDASPDIIACGGPSLKHSITAEYRLNGQYTDSKYNPTEGLDSYAGVEAAGPPGDVGFVKVWSGGSIHLPIGPSSSDSEEVNIGFLSRLIPRGLAFHSVYNCGIMKAFSYGGLCSNGGSMTNVSDRFYVGGSHQLRGFLPAGIGPRADVVSKFCTWYII